MSDKKSLFTDDTQLLKECLKNNQSAFRYLYEKYASSMYAIALRYAKNTMEAQDILQEGFIRVFQNLQKFRYKGSLEGWIRKIIINTAINYYKANIKYNNSQEVDLTYNLPSELISYIKDKITYNQLLRLIQSLPKGYRLVFNMYVIDGFNHKQIAEYLGISENTSKTQLLRARRYLQKKINQLMNYYYYVEK